MPHLTLEYTANIGEELLTAELFSRLHASLAELAGIELAGCKSRAVRLERFLVGDGTARVAFAHLDVRIFSGRPSELRAALARRCLAVLEEYLAPAVHELDLQLTVEVRDIERAAYAKALVRPA